MLFDEVVHDFDAVLGPAGGHLIAGIGVSSASVGEAIAYLLRKAQHAERG